MASISNTMPGKLTPAETRKIHVMVMLRAIVSIIVGYTASWFITMYLFRDVESPGFAFMMIGCIITAIILSLMNR